VEVKFNYNEKEYSVTLNEWQKGNKHRFYIGDKKKQYGYYDAISHTFSLSGSPSGWKDSLKEAVEQYVKKYLLLK